MPDMSMEYYDFERSDYPTMREYMYKGRREKTYEGQPYFYVAEKFTGEGDAVINIYSANGDTATIYLTPDELELYALACLDVVNRLRGQNVDQN